MKHKTEHIDALKMAIRKLLHSEDVDFVQQGLRVVRTTAEDLIPSVALLVQVPKLPRKRYASARHDLNDPEEDKENVFPSKRPATKEEQENNSKSNEQALIKVFQLEDELAMSKKLYHKERELRSLVCH